MYTIKNLLIIGTSHISKESVNEVASTIKKHSPDIIALELDPLRFKKLISKRKERFHPSQLFQKGFFLNLIGAWIERYLGKKAGILPGTEMKKAISLAKKNKIKIALIDQNIKLTLYKLKSRFTLKEKLTFLKNIFKPFLFLQKQKHKLKIDLTKVPEQKLINQLTLQVKQDYPSVYKTLIQERDHIMAHRLLTLMKENKKVLAIVGAGHVPGISRLLKCNFKKKKSEAS